MPIEGGKKSIKVILTGLLIAVGLGIILGGTAWTALHLFHEGEVVAEHQLKENHE
nr:hypothetical protein [uncultured Lachnoclostridium sp.]